jgi:hypothetical protein
MAAAGATESQKKPGSDKIGRRTTVAADVVKATILTDRRHAWQQGKRR